MMFRALAVLASAGLCSAAYPSQFPFENESIVPSGPLAATPSWTFDDTDAGGYVYAYSYMFDMSADFENFLSFQNNGFLSHLNVVRSNAVPLRPPEKSNCTAKDRKLGPYSYYGELAGIKICDAGECCKEFWDTYTFFNVAAPYDAYYTDLGKIYEDGGCTEMVMEPIYCSFMAGSQNQFCMEQYSTPTDRMVVYACYDSVYNHYMGCPLYKVTGTIFRPEMEPEAYLAASSGEEVNAVNALYWMPDRVCHPYSYYFPEYAKASSSSASASSSSASGSGSGSSTASTDSAESSAGTFLCTVFIATVALF